MYGRRSEAPFVEEVPILMREKDVSLNQLAAMVGVNYSHLWRVIGRKDNKKVTGDLAERVAVAFELPSDWFPKPARHGCLICYGTMETYATVCTTSS